MPDACPAGARIIRLDAPRDRYTLARTAPGHFVAMDASGGLVEQAHVDDAALWRAVAGDTLTHVASGRTTPAASLDAVELAAGPERRPSEYLAELRENGWTCVSAIVPEGVLDNIRRVAGTGRWEAAGPAVEGPSVLRHAAIARAAAEPVTLWLTRQYLGTDAIQMAHAPSLAVLGPDDGQRNVQGWHTDFPYLWGSPAWISGSRMPEGGSGGFPLGLQRNLCVDEFRAGNGATRFVLGSHVHNHAPSEHLGRDADVCADGHRAQHGLPYEGEGTDVIEAPAGSVILYDARTWHRAGVNRSAHKRAALLQAMTPKFVLPFTDVSDVYARFADSEHAAQLDERERNEMAQLLVHSIVGPDGVQPIRASGPAPSRAR